jgi:hypothetical protein
MGEIVDEDDSVFGIEKGQETIFGLARKGSEASSKRGASSRTGFVVECYVACAVLCLWLRIGRSGRGLADLSTCQYQAPEDTYAKLGPHVGRTCGKVVVCALCNTLGTVHLV